MSELKALATTLWTELLAALRADGHIAACVQTSGPATTKVIVDTCQAVAMAKESHMWLRMAFKPQPGREVIAHDNDGGFHVLTYDGNTDTWKRGRQSVSPRKFNGWRYLQYHAPATEVKIEQETQQ